jgi:DNA-directed RNA polymerase sigma subunit (sigma70/sigma32)
VDPGTRSIADQAKIVRVPMYMINNICGVTRTTRQLFNEMGRKPTPEELTEKLGMPPGLILPTMANAIPAHRSR